MSAVGHKSNQLPSWCIDFSRNRLADENLDVREWNNVALEIPWTVQDLGRETNFHRDMSRGSISVSALRFGAIEFASLSSYQRQKSWSVEEDAEGRIHPRLVDHAILNDIRLFGRICSWYSDASTWSRYGIPGVC
jgi:hypothetical protein